jgi:uncharacterized protein YbjT (DUF2867 family)
VSTVLVTGGSGVLGRHVVTLLRARGDEVRVLSRRAGTGTHVGDLARGTGLAEALHGVDRVVHAATDSPLGRADLRQTENLLAAARDVAHLLYVSIVGIDRVAYGYYAHKLACEEAIQAGSTPYTILRATQFHQLLEQWLRAAGRLPVVPLPLDWRVQPVAAAEVAERVVDVVAGDPVGRADDFAGPEVLDLARVVEVWRARYHRPRSVVGIRIPGQLSRAVRRGDITAPARANGRQTWEQYVQAQTNHTSQGAGQ